MIQCHPPTKNDRRGGTGSQQWGGQINDLIETGSSDPIALSAYWVAVFGPVSERVSQRALF